MIAIVVTDYRRFDLVETLKSSRRSNLEEPEVFALPGGKTVTREALLKWVEENNHVVRFIKG